MLKDANKKDHFVISFKETLNSKIRESLHSVTTEENFKKIFPEYFKWSNDITSKILEAVKKSKEKI